MGSFTRTAVGCPPRSGVATDVSASVVSAVVVGEVAGTCAGPGCSVSHAVAVMSRSAARMRFRIDDTSRASARPGPSGCRWSALLRVVAGSAIQDSAAQDICTVVSDGAGPAPVVNRPDVLVNVTFLFRPAPAGEIVIRGKFSPDHIRGHGQLAGPERLAKRFQRLRAGIFFTYRKGIAPFGWPPAVSRVGRLAAAFCPAALDSLGHCSPHAPLAEVPLRGAGSRLHGSMKVSAHLRCSLSNFFTEYQSSEHAARNFASLRSWRVLRRWQLRHSQRRFSGVKALSIAAGPRARATFIGRRWSISSEGPPHISQSVCCISSGCWPDATR